MPRRSLETDTPQGRSPRLIGDPNASSETNPSHQRATHIIGERPTSSDILDPECRSPLGLL